MAHSRKATAAVYTAASANAVPISARPRRDSGSFYSSSTSPQPSSTTATHPPVRGFSRNSIAGMAHTTRFCAL